MTRKYFKSSIESLEKIFKEKNDNLEILEELKEELSHRKTKRSQRLHDQVSERLVALKGQSEQENRSEKQGQRPSSHSPKSGPSAKDGPQQSPNQSSQAKTPPKSENSGNREKTASSPMPPISNRPEEILSAWTALEVLSPQSYVRPEDLAGGDRSRIAKLNGLSLPWERGEKSRPNARLYYQVVLGSIKMEPAVEQLIERYGDARPEKPGVRGQSALATIVVNRHGKLVDSPAVGISSFGWGVITALNGEMEDLARWPEVEQELTERIEKLLVGATAEGEEQKKVPLTRADLSAALLFTPI